MPWVIVAVVVVVVVDFWVVMAVLSRRRGASLPGRRVLGWDPSDPAATDSGTVFPGGGHGLLDRAAYGNYQAGQVTDFDLPAEAVADRKSVV